MTTIKTTTEFNSIPKRVSHAFDKDVYLLGRLADSRELIWLEEPSWDCSWYWGFGYLEVYTNQSNPSISADISMHTHWDSQIKGNLSNFAKTTFTQGEGDKLCTLFNTFYTLKESAATAHNNDNKEWERINKIEIPAITKQIIDILTPKAKQLQAVS